MKKLTNNKYIIIAVTLIAGVIIGWWLKPSASQQTEEHVHAQEDTIYTCSMHPQVRQNGPGKCPICGMDLIPVSEESGSINPNAISMSPTAMIIAGVSTTTVSKKPFAKEIRLTGKIDKNESSLFSQTPHIPGRVEAMNVTYEGQYVKKGQVVARIYSPDLITAQEELLLSQANKEQSPELFEAAKRKLLNWKLTQSQIDQVLQKGKPIQEFPILANQSGYVVAKKATIGDHLTSGQALYDLTNLSTVWVLFDIYETDLQWINEGNEVEFTVSSYPGEEFTGKISYIDPTIDPKTRVAKARVVMNNPNDKFKPEMLVSGKIKAQAGKSTDQLTIPKSAVMWTGERSVVYVKLVSDEAVSFVLREIELGPALGDFYVVKSGLDEGEEIATSGTFSIDAAAQLAGKPSMMSPDGTAKAVHQHGEVTSVTDPFENPIPSFEVNQQFKNQLTDFYGQYLSVKDALVASDAAQALKNAKSMQQAFGKIDADLLKSDALEQWNIYSNALRSSIKDMTETSDLTEMRQALIPLSNELFRSIKSFHPTIKGYFQYCPMADNNKGAYWISGENDIKNPYFGDAMLTCGEVVEEIGKTN